MSLLSSCKDRVLEKMGLPILNKSLLQPYGQATSLRIDSSAKTVEVSLALKGETEPLQLQIKQYELIKEGEASYLIVKDIQTSKAWLTILAEQHLLNRRLALPPQAASALSGLL